MTKRVFAVVAHPDDIEFFMAGTMLLLARAGFELHYMTVGNGCYGSVSTDPPTTAAIRGREAQSAAALMGAVYHPPLVDDVMIFYERDVMVRLASVMRDVAPDILLLHSPDDYMEDHMISCRLGVTAAFCRSIAFFPVEPPREMVLKEMAVYHAQPAANRNYLGGFVMPDFLVDISSVLDDKKRLLSEHRSQRDWLDKSQGFGSYVETMAAWGKELGAASGVLDVAEGWRRHHPSGFCPPEANPLAEALEDYVAEIGES